MKKEKILDAKLKDSLKKTLNGKHQCYFNVDNAHDTYAIKSHSIWNSGILNLLSINNKVFWLDPKNRYEIFGRNEGLFSEVLVSNATIYRGFCSDHDDEIFKPIEKNTIYNGELNEIFLYSYRAFSYQHVQNKLSKIVYNRFADEIAQLAKNNSQAFNSYDVNLIRSIINIQDRRTKRGDKIFESTKKIFHEVFKNENLEEEINKNFILKSYKVNHKIEFACSGIADPLVDTIGRYIITETSGFLILNIFPLNKNESYFTIGLLKVDEPIYRDILLYIDNQYTDYTNSNPNSFLLVIQNLMVNGSENIVLSKKLYDNLNESGEMDALVRQFEGSVSSETNNQLYYQDLKKNYGYNLF